MWKNYVHYTTFGVQYICKLNNGGKEIMKQYKGYQIEKLTRVDYIVRDLEGNKIHRPDETMFSNWSFRTQKEAKAFIDELTK